MNDSLQAVQTSALNSGIQNKTFSFVEIFTQGGIMGILVAIILLLLLFYSLYIFFERYLILNKVLNNKSLLKDVGDLIHEAKINAALELCRKSGTPEGRVLYKGLSRIGKPAREINDVMEKRAQLELFDLEKKTSILGVISGFAPMLGFLATVIGISMTFLSSGINISSTQLMAGGIYTAMVNAAIGLFVGLIAYLFYNILVIKTKKVLYTLQLTMNDFLDLLNKPVI